jgi:hypothetical protein
MGNAEVCAGPSGALGPLDPSPGRNSTKGRRLVRRFPLASRASFAGAAAAGPPDRGGEVLWQQRKR